LLKINQETDADCVAALERVLQAEPRALVPALATA
jgi:hypothetical protein